MDSMDKIEEYLESVEEYFFSSFSAVTHSLPDVHEVVNRLWVDISRYGPGMPAFPDVNIPALGDFKIPPPPPPPPVQPTWLGRSADWVGRNPWKTSGIAVGIVGAGLLVGYTTAAQKGRRHLHKFKTQSSERKQVVVVLGGDTPYALALIIDLEKKGYIVITSVSTIDAAEDIERKCHGYVRALILDPYELGTVPVFLRSLTSTLSRKFPINASGDPYASPASHPYIHSVISLLTLSTTLAIQAPLEHLNLHTKYLPYLNATQIAPLQVIQALLPLLRTGSARTRDKGMKSIIVCLPATDARVGLPFASIQAMSAAGTLRAVEVLRREVSIAALTDKSESMKNIRVVVVEVGSFDLGVRPSAVPSESIYKAMEDWTASEKVMYGPAFASILYDADPPMSRWESVSSVSSDRHHFGIKRRQTNISVFVNRLVAVVGDGRHHPSLFGVGIYLGRFRNWIRGEHFSVGAGGTYSLASRLPSSVLDFLLDLPHYLIAIRNRLLMTQPFRPPQDLPPPLATKPAPLVPDEVAEPESVIENEPGEDCSEVETHSEPDTESTMDATVSDSWVSLNMTAKSQA